MYKIAILGCENSHANNFLALIADGAYPEIEVVGVYSDETSAAEKLSEEYGVKIMESYDSLVGAVDGVMITARHGDNHYKYAKPYLASGIPMFIDKPISCTEEDGVEFMRDAKAHGVRLSGGSTCAALAETLELADAVASGALGDVRGGCIAAPLDRYSKYGGFYFYSQHLVEMIMRVFGYNVESVFCDDRGNSVNVTFHYPDYSVNGIFVEHGAYYYSMSAYGQDKCISREANITRDCFRHEMDGMLALLRGEPMEKSYEDFLSPVFVINAILRSIESGKWEKTKKIVI
ncbi:MAG: Gfo/Idh/MocA family oxidoreductase [Clostridia bacterium]|nr:Gfo/Idh/MocA family oxidoreductase [Clostridia bacterium]